MKKYILLWVLSFCLFFSSLVLADSGNPPVMDGAGLLKESEKELLTERLESLGESLDAEIAVVTRDSVFGLSAEDYAENLFYQDGYGTGSEKNGVLLVLAMEERLCGIFAHGSGEKALPSEEIRRMGDEISPYLSRGEYYEGFCAFADACERRMEGMSEGASFDWQSTLLISFAVALVIALITVFVFKSQLKSVRSQPHANSYVKHGSLNITHAHEFYLYRRVDRRAKPQKSSSSGSSSGSSGGFRF